MKILSQSLAVFVCVLLAGCMDPQWRRGQDALGQGRYKDAIHALDAMHKKAPTNPGVKRDLASAHRSMASSMMDAGRCDQAAVHLTAADELTRPILVDHQRLFDCTQTHETPPDVRQSVMENLVTLGETRGPILRALVASLLDQERHEDALKHAPAAHARFSLRTADFRRLGFAAASLNQHGDAVTYFNHFIRAVPTDPLARLKLAASLEALGRLESARRVYESLTVDFPQNPVLFLRLADFCKRHQDRRCVSTARSKADALRGIQTRQRGLRPLLKSKR